MLGVISMFTGLALQAEAVRTLRDEAMENLQAKASSGPVYVGGAVAVAVRRNHGVADARAQERAEAFFAQQQQKREQARMRGEEIRRNKELIRHEKKHKQDCEVEEIWSEPGACSAPCGGGVATRVLKRRSIRVPPDEFGYGKQCPDLCDESSDEACGELGYQTCSHAMCTRECSFVDLGNPLPGPGTVVDWQFKTSSSTVADWEDCVFQLWQTLPGPRLRLLGETVPVGQGAERVFDFHGQELMIHANSSVHHSKVVLGFRGCDLLRKDGTLARDLVDESVARICFRGASAYHLKHQTPDLDEAQRRFLIEARRESRHMAGQLFQNAGEADGVAASESVSIGNMISAQGTLSPAESQFELSVEMRARPPEPPLLTAFQIGTNVGFKVDDALNGGAPVQSIAIFLRKIFGSSSTINGGRCVFTQLPRCAASHAPCFDESSVGGKSFVLSNLPFATVFEVQVSAENEVGQSDGSNGVFTTVARSNEPLSTCKVSGWMCGDDKYVVNQYPEADDPECKLNTPALPICKMRPLNKCDGRKYWQTCVPLLASGSDLTCAQVNGKFPQKICTHVLEKKGNSSTDKRCKTPGCHQWGFSGFGATKKCCCTPGEESNAQADSPHCACSVDSCSDLGLVEAVEPLVSCRH